MHIRFEHCIAGVDFCFNVGDVVDFPEAEAKRLIAAGIAQEVETLETTEAPDAVTQTTEQPQPRRIRRRGR